MLRLAKAVNNPLNFKDESRYLRRLRIWFLGYLLEVFLIRGERLFEKYRDESLVWQRLRLL